MIRVAPATKQKRSPCPLQECQNASETRTRASLRVQSPRLPGERPLTLLAQYIWICKASSCAFHTMWYAAMRRICTRRRREPRVAARGRESKTADYADISISASLNILIRQVSFWKCKDNLWPSMIVNKDHLSGPREARRVALESWNVNEAC